jgi:hypothetical protein
MRNMKTPNHAKRIAAFGISWALAVALGAAAVPAASASPPDHVLERARQAVADGQQAVEGLEDAGAAGDEQKAKGLENATAAIEAAAARKAEREGIEFPGQGKALGRGHSELVHAILASGSGSPSDVAPHGEAVTALAQAFEKVKADHPGQGQGLDKEKPAGGADDGAEAEVDND